MKVEELVDKYNQARKNPNGYDFSKHIVLKYMPYAEKTALVKAIIKATSYIKVNDVELYKRDTSSMYFIFTMKLIEKYTDIEIDVNNLYRDYDMLMKAKIMESLVNQIPADEISILKGMLEMERDDLEANTRSLVSFLETKTEAMKLAMDSLGKIIEKPEIQAKLAEFIK